VITAKLRCQANAAGSFNFLLLLKFFGGWVATLVVAGLTSAAFTAQGIYAPGRNSVRYRADMNSAFNATSAGIAKTLAAAGNVTGATPAQQQALAWGSVSVTPGPGRWGAAPRQWACPLPR
jgi:hypothetical protein